MRILHPSDEEKIKVSTLEQMVKRMYSEAGYDGWSWTSPP